MKALFVWNSVSKKYLKSILPEDLDHLVVDSKKQFDSLDIEKENFDQIFFCLELNWQGKLFEGYELAHKVVTTWENEQNPPNIQFFSFLNRDQLFEFNNDIHKFYAKSFYHYLLPIDSKLIFKKYSISKWRYLKRYALQESGVLNRLQHTVSSLINKEQSELIKEVPKVRNQLHQLSSIVGDRIVGLYHQDYDLNLRDYLQKLTTLIKIRISELEGSIKAPEEIPENNKPLLLLLEDDKKYAERIQDLLNDYFNVFHFEYGIEALEEIKLYGHNYSVAVCDLELLQRNKSVDQDVQGIEVLEYVREHKPHITWRIITGLPRKGVKELIDVELNNILHKNQLEFYGYNEVLEQFVHRILKQVSDNKFLLRLPGPNKSFWNLVSKQGKEGGKFKLFYYDLKNSNPELFNSMWQNIKDKWTAAIKDKNNEIRISTNLIKTENSAKWLANPKNSLQEKVDLLERILLHRLIFISKFKKGETISYKNHGDGYANDPLWEEPLSASPKAYTPILGFETKNLTPTVPKGKDPVVTFVFEDYGELFHEEIEIMKSIDELRKNAFTNFYDNYEDACETLAYVQFLILEDQKNSNSQFKKDYGILVVNPFDLTEELSKKIASSLSKETRMRSLSPAWNKVNRFIMEFKYGRDLENEQREFVNFPFSQQLDRFLNET